MQVAVRCADFQAVKKDALGIEHHLRLQVFDVETACVDGGEMVYGGVDGVTDDH